MSCEASVLDGRGATVASHRLSQRNEALIQSLPLILLVPNDGMFAGLWQWTSTKDRIAAELTYELASILRDPELRARLAAARHQPDTPKPDLPPERVDFGRYHALIIGNNAYDDLPRLKTARNDATDLAVLLQEKYGFEIELLVDATREDIVLAFTRLRNSLTPRDNLLVYYAGHGSLDVAADEGYWLPVNASEDNPVNWISSSSLTAVFKAMRAKHILVVADSCYAGKLTRGIELSQRTDVARLVRKRARVVITSGGLEPVADAGGDGRHSVFATALLGALRENSGILEGAALFVNLRQSVVVNADQTPEYANIRKAGHEGGDFLFVPRR